MDPGARQWVETTGRDYDGGRTFVRLRNKTVYNKIGEPAKVEIIRNVEDFSGYEKQVDKEGIILGSCLDPQTIKPVVVSIEAAPVLMSESEGKKYENWEKQLKFTEESVLRHPLKFLPMFHYDPRRWQFGGAQVNAALIAKLTGVNALYLGFKMYTAQGYQPWDVRRLPTLKDFYARCCRSNIPILNHCTPGGARSHEDMEYFNFEHPFDDMKEEEAARKGCNATEYFENNFVSPKAWKKVLDDEGTIEGEKEPVALNKLRLCLAHFGGPKKPGPEWSQQIIDMILTKDNKYPNLYTDISSSFADADFRKSFKKMFTGEVYYKDKEEKDEDKKKKQLTKDQIKKLRSRILFGTDWYMIFAYGALNKQKLWDYCTETKGWLDSFDTSLWPYFTQYNPYRFYRLDIQVPRIADSIIKAMKDKDKRNIVEGQEPSSTEDIELIEREAAWVKAANLAHEIYEETSCTF